jgi:hypothetical protein
MLVYTAVPKSRRKKKKHAVVARKVRVVSTGTYVPPPRFQREDSTRNIPSLITNEPFVPARRSVMDPVQLAKESQAVQDAIIAKSKRLAPQFNKGAVQYITEEADLTTLGRKIR